MSNSSLDPSRSLLLAMSKERSRRSVAAIQLDDPLTYDICFLYKPTSRCQFIEEQHLKDHHSCPFTSCDAAAVMLGFAFHGHGDNVQCSRDDIMCLI